MIRALAAIVCAAAVAAAAATTAAACGTGPNVRGTLERGPITPVCVVGRPCDAPAPGVELVFLRGGKEVKRVTTGTGGRFALRLRPGAYAVRAVRAPRIGTGLTPKTFRVPKKGVLRLRLHLDTGIR